MTGKEGPAGSLNDLDALGLDLSRFRAYFEAVRPGAVKGPLRAWLITGGKSNITYEVTDGESDWILRRPPLSHVLPSAHDMSREYRVIRALAPTEVPVPATYALCDDPEVIGAPFYVMEKVEGTPYRHAAQLAPLGADRTRLISTRMVEALAALHRVDPCAVGLIDFGRPRRFLDRQVRRWRRQLDASRSRELPGTDDLHDLLTAHVPTESSLAVVHGDFRLDNLLIDHDDRVAAVLDWEMATVGDPLTDVALLVVYQRIAELDGGDTVSDVTSAPGFLSAEHMLSRYAELSGRNLSSMAFYIGLAYYKLAVILEGIHYRHVHGQSVGAGFDTVGVLVTPLIEAGLTSMQEYR